MFKKNLIFPRSQFPASFHDLLIILRKILKKPQLALYYLNALLKTFSVYLFKKKIILNLTKKIEFQLNTRVPHLSFVYRIENDCSNYCTCHPLNFTKRTNSKYFKIVKSSAIFAENKILKKNVLVDCRNNFFL